MEERWYFKEKYIGFNGRASNQRKTRSTKLICQLCLKLMLFFSLAHGERPIDTKLASVPTYIGVIKFIRFVSTGTVSTSTR